MIHRLKIFSLFVVQMLLLSTACDNELYQPDFHNEKDVLIGVSFLLSDAGDTAPILQSVVENNDVNDDIDIDNPMEGLYSPLEKSLPDPGVDHGEWNADVWTKMNIFFVYSSGEVIGKEVLRTDLQTGVNNVNGFTDYYVKLPLKSGRVTHVYAIAYSDVKPLLHVNDENITIGVLNDLKTVPLSDTVFKNNQKARTDYLLSLFSGIDSSGFDVVALSDTMPYVHISLVRLVSKVDIQYDLVAAYDNAEFINPIMSAVEFRGLDSGYFFPDKAKSAISDTIMFSANSYISERNGRLVFYALPGMRNEFTFSVKFSPKKRVSYTAVFEKPLQKASWHKVNLNITGSSLPKISGDNYKIILK